MINRKKSIVALLTVALSLSITGVTSKTVYAGEYSSYSVEAAKFDGAKATDSNGVTWWYGKYNDGTICISGTYDLKSVMEIPSTLAGCTVTGISSLLGYENTIMYKESIIGKPVNKVLLPSGIKVIGQGAFSRCANLTEIQIPESVNYIGTCAFNDKWLEANRDSNGFVVVNGILVDGHKASGDVTIPSNIKCIGDGAFGNYNFTGRFPQYKNITSVTIPSNVKRIGKEAFLRCDLTKATIAEGVEVIDERAFDQCSKLTEVKLPQSVKELATNAFDDDYALKSTTSNSNGLIISNGVLILGKDARGDVSIPSNVTKIQAGAFEDNKNITSVKITSSVIEIGERAFSGSSIQSVNIPGSVKKISDAAFDHCSSLTNVKIEDGVETIGSSAFSETAISKINIPNSVINIGFLAFSNCKNLSEINYKYGTTIGGSAFKGTPWLDKQSKTGNFTILNGVLLSCDKSASGEVIIPSGVKEIAGGAFNINMNITSVIIPDGVTTIDVFAFSECRNLTKVNIPASVKTMYKDSFLFCGDITFIGDGAEFAKGSKLAKDVIANGYNSSNNAKDNSNIQIAKSNAEAVSDKVKPGWSLIDNHWYYGYSDGTKKTGWYNENGEWYYFYGNGQMAKEVLDLGGGFKYYLKPNLGDGKAVMATGGQYIAGDWYYFNPVSDGYKGAMKRGWIYDGGNWFYFYSSGQMARDTTIDGYYVNSNGAWVK